MIDSGKNASADSLQQERALLEFSNAILQHISTAVPLAAMLDFIAQKIESVEPEMRCSILVLDPTGRYFQLVAAPSLPAEFNAAVTGAEIGPAIGSCGTAAYRGAAVFVADIASDPLWANFKSLAQGPGLASCWSSPIFSTQGKVLGTFAVYWTTSRQEASSITRRYVETATQLACIAIENAGREALLQGQLAELRRWQQLTLGREGRVISLKREVNDLLARLGEPPRYASAGEVGDTP